MDEEQDQIEIENAEMLDWLSKGLALLDAAEGGDSLHPWAQIMVRHDASSLPVESAGDRRRAGVECFMLANGLLPRSNPWFWFQIGWNLFAFEGGPRDLPLARYDLNVALEAEPNCRPAHLAMAWVLYQQWCAETNQDKKPLESLWLGPIGEHLRKALEGVGWEYRGNPTLRLAAQWAQPIRVLLEWQHWASPPYFITKASEFAAVRALEELTNLVPESHRFWHAYVMADLVEGDALKLRWEEEALRWPVQDDVALSVVNTSLARLQQRAGHLIASLRSFYRAGEHILSVAQSDERGLLGSWNLSIEWLDQCPYEGGEVPEGTLELYLQVVDVALAVWQADDNPSAFQHLIQQMGLLTAWAGRQLLDMHDRKRAQKYLIAAQEFDKSATALAEEFEDFEEDQPPPVSGSGDWRVIAARSWRDIHIERSEWRQAEIGNDRILELLPGDHDSLEKKLALAQIVSSMALQEAQTRDRSDGEMSRIFSSIFPEVPKPVPVSPGTQSKVADLVKSLEQLVEASAANPEAIQRLFDQVHDFAQRDTQLSPRALRSADQRLLDELGSETLGSLHPDSRLFLETAEAFFIASEGVAPQIDSALIAVEYAKVVETELRTRFLTKLAEKLSEAGYQGRLKVSRTGETIAARRLNGLSLGEAAYLLTSFADQTPDKTVLRVIERMRVLRDGLRQVANDIDNVAHYRNDAAHTGKVSRDAVARLRNLLIKEGSLKRLVDLVSRSMGL